MSDSAADKDLKVSFCITCRGEKYLERLKKTLPENIRRNTGEGHHGNVEFVVVAYGDPNVTQWLKETFPDEIKSGLVRAVDLPREQAPFFKMAHAKNVAHRMATGDVLCNLDGDNITGENFSGWLSQQFSKNPEIVVSLTTRGKLSSKLRTGDSKRDMTGRVVISRENFEKLHGYDEQFNAAKDNDDTNLKERAFASGLKSVPMGPVQMGEILGHDDSERLENMSPADQEKSRGNFGGHSLLKRAETARRVVFGEASVIPRNLAAANPDGRYGCAEVTCLDGNLEPEAISLGAAVHPQWRETLRPVAASRRPGT